MISNEPSKIRSEPPSGAGVSIWIWLAVFAGGTALFLFRIDHESLWHDEGFSAAFSGRSFAEIWRLRAVDNHSPLYYLTLHGFRLAAGDSVFALRLYSAMAGIALALVGPIWLRRAVSPTLALWFSILVFTTPVVLAFAQETRMYLPAAAALTGGVAAAYLAIRDNRWLDWVGALLLLSAACYFHIFAMLGAAVAGLFLVIWSARLGRRQLACCLALFIVVGLSYTFWLPTLLNKASAVSKDFWISPPGWKTLGAGLIYPYMLRFAFSTTSVIAALVALACFIAGVIITFRRTSRGTPFFIVCIATYASVLVLTVGLSLTLRPIYLPQYMTPLVGLLLIAVAFSIEQFSNRWKMIAIMALVLINAPMFVRQYTERHNGPMNEVAAEIEQAWQPGDAILHTGEATAGAGFMHFRNYPQYIYRDEKSRFYSPLEVYEPEIEVIENLDEIAVRHSRIWILKGFGHLNGAQANDAASKFAKEPDWTAIREPDSWFGVDIQRVETH